MTSNPASTGSLRRAAFYQRDLSGTTFDTCTLEGARFRDCNLSGVIIVASYVEDLRVSSLHGQGARVVVDDVDVSAYVVNELDRRFPERVALRALGGPNDYQAVFAMLETGWDETLRRAEQLPEAARFERVDGEWSIVETLHHLVLADDCWITRQYYETDDAFHPWALPPTDYPLDQRGGLGVDEDARPTYDEVVAVFRDRRARGGSPTPQGRSMAQGSRRSRTRTAAMPCRVSRTLRGEWRGTSRGRMPGLRAPARRRRRLLRVV